MYENHWAILDGAAFHDKKTAHDMIRRELCFPDYYGGNLDALYDCLTEMGEEQICFINTDDGSEYFKKVYRVFRDAAKENPLLSVVDELPAGETEEL